MGSITERPRKDGSTAYLAQVKVKRGGKVIFRVSETFDRRQSALAWISKIEQQTKTDEGIAILKTKKSVATLGDAIDRYVREYGPSIGKTKQQVLRSLKAYDIADKQCDAITSSDIYNLAQDLSRGRQPQTVGNYLSHLGAIFAIARAAWGVPLDPDAMKDAAIVSKRMGYTAKSSKRERRPTLGELADILTHFEERQLRTPRMLPMTKIVLFAMFSTRRLEEITRITWADLEVDNSRVLVRDMKNPGEKMGNHVWCDLPGPALRIIQSMPQTEEMIFPYSTDAIGANFTRACKLLDIQDLRFHDLRHEGVSRLFEMGLTIPQAAAVSGHRSWNSLKRYSHIIGSGDKYEGWPWIERVTEGQRRRLRLVSNG